MAESMSLSFLLECATVRLPHQRCFDDKDHDHQLKPNLTPTGTTAPTREATRWAFPRPVVCSPAEICPGRASTSRHAMPCHLILASHRIALHDTPAGGEGGKGRRARTSPTFGDAGRSRQKHPYQTLFPSNPGCGGGRGAEVRRLSWATRARRLKTEDLRGGGGGGGRDAF